MTSGVSQDRLRELVVGAIRRSRRLQKDVGQMAGINGSHLSDMLCGRRTLRVDHADALLKVVGKRLVITVEDIPKEDR